MKLKPAILWRAATTVLLGGLLVSVSSSCTDSSKADKAPDPDSGQQEKAGGHRRHGDAVTVRGVLTHYPQDVKSVEAWLGHEFVVEGTPIRPTETVPAEKLLPLAGKAVRVEGTWNAGKEWQPTEEEASLSTPVFPTGDPVMVGSGVEASTVVEEPTEAQTNDEG